MKPIWPNCAPIARPMEKIVATVPHGKDRRCERRLLICRRCGKRMTVHYHEIKRGKRLYPEYVCQKEHVEQGDDKCCQRLLGAGLDAAVAELLLARLTPLSIETSL
jgi:Recombinase zinc beta ribbon domain